MVAWVFLRLLALIYLAAFVSLAVQIDGLLGSDGILPVRDFLETAFNQLGMSAYWQKPTVFWMDASDFALRRNLQNSLKQAELVAQRGPNRGVTTCSR